MCTDVGPAIEDEKAEERNSPEPDHNHSSICDNIKDTAFAYNKQSTVEINNAELDKTVG